MRIKSNREMHRIFTLLAFVALSVAMSGYGGNSSASNNSAANTNATPEANVKPNNVEPSGNYIVTFNSFGGVKIGMTIAQASQALGTELVRGQGYEDACYYVESQGLQGVRFMVTNEKIARIDVTSSKYATNKGAKIGDSLGKIKNLYPKAKVFRQKYDKRKYDIQIYSGDKQFMIIFESAGKRITGYRVGNTEEVSYVEGCS
jgi:outer membrane protein assembly factor BamE (lipoprotein component of BamABCDE complex)